MKLCALCNTHFEDKLEVCPNDAAQLIYIGKTPLIGSIIGNRYKIVSAVGAGSMGVVYKAIQQSTGREMAMKVLHGSEGADSAHVRRFRREARAVSVLNHENIVRLYDFGFMDDGQPYIVTEFVRGKTLSQLLRERGKLTVNEVLPVMHQVCDAVEEAHRLKIVHRDLKPENIILTEPDQRLTGNTKHNWRTRRIKVVDFGVAKLSSDANSSSASLTVEGKVCGSPGYMSPEQCKGLPVDVRSDIYSLGIVLYEILSGHRPFSADTVMGLLFMHVNEQPPMMNALCLDLNLPGALEQVIRKALNKAPEERQQNVQELWQEFEAACHGKSKTPEKQKSTSNWIPFGGIEGKILKEEAQRLSLISSADVMEPIEHPELEYSPLEEIEYEEESTPWLSRPVIVSLSLAAVAIVVMAQTNWFPFRVLLPDPQLAQADVLIQQGKLPDALIAIERMRKQKKASPDDVEDVNKLYLAVADKYSQKKDYSGALESLQRVPAKSKYFQKAMQMASKYRKLASAE